MTKSLNSINIILGNKGGTGKTTEAMTVSYLLNKELKNNDYLVVDLDRSINAQKTGFSANHTNSGFPSSNIFSFDTTADGDVGNENKLAFINFINDNQDKYMVIDTGANFFAFDNDTNDDINANLHAKEPFFVVLGEIAQSHRINIIGILDTDANTAKYFQRLIQDLDINIPDWHANPNFKLHLALQHKDTGGTKSEIHKSYLDSILSNGVVYDIAFNTSGVIGRIVNKGFTFTKALTLKSSDFQNFTDLMQFKKFIEVNEKSHNPLVPYLV